MAASTVLNPYLPPFGFGSMRDALVSHMMVTPDHTGTDPPAPAVVIDHLSYPHIMDLIIQYAPHQSRIALRSVSREYKLRMDKMLCSHIRINNRVILSHFAAPFNQGRIPGLRFNSRDVSQAERDRGLSLLHKHCRVVDYYRSVGLLYRDREDLAPALSNVMLVRRQDPVLCQIRTPVIVDFLLVCPRSVRANWFNPMAVGIAPIPEGATTMIVSAIFHPYHPRLPDCQLNILSFARHLEEVVLILTPRTEGLPTAPPAAMNRPEQRLGLLASVVDAMSCRIPDVKFTLIGVEELDPLWLGLPSFIPSKEAILDAIEAAWMQWRPGELLRGIRACDYVAFLSRDEYRKRVGQREYELYTEA